MGGSGDTDDGQPIVLREITGPRASGPEGLGEAPSGVLGDVLVEGARTGTRQQDALDGLRVEGSVEGSVSERGVEVSGVIALAQQEDSASVVRPVAGRCAADQADEVAAAIAHVAEGGAELVEIGGAFVTGAWV